MFILRRSVGRPVAALILSLSLRRLWSRYQRTAVAHAKGRSRRDMAFAQLAFYSGAGGVLKVLAHMIEQGDSDVALRTISRFGQQVKAIQSSAAARPGTQ